MKDFNLNTFEKCFKHCKCDDERIVALYKFIVSIKLNDIFARGFTLDQRLEKASLRSSVIIESQPINLLNLYDVLMETFLNGFTSYHTQQKHSSSFVIVFNDALTLPTQKDEFLGFYTKNTVLQKTSQEYYDNIDNKLKFSFEIKDFYCSSYPYLKRVIQMFELMQDRVVTGTKTIMQKSNSNFQARNSGGLMDAVTSMLPNSKKQKAESEAFLHNDTHSVLSVPAETNILFPTADVTQIEKAYMRAVDWMLAFFRIPNTKFFGQSPSGFQSTGNLEILNYEQTLDEIFSNDIKPVLTHMSSLINVKEEITTVSFYKLQQLDRINNVRATTNSKQIQEFCDNMITAISGIESEINNDINNTDDIIEEDTIINEGEL
jgi:hypothetical protein